MAQDFCQKASAGGQLLLPIPWTPGPKGQGPRGTEPAGEVLSLEVQDPNLPQSGAVQTLLRRLRPETGGAEPTGGQLLLLRNPKALWALPALTFPQRQGS